MKKLVYALLIAGFAGSAYAAQVETEKKEVVIKPEDITKVTALVEENTLVGANSFASSIKTVNKQRRIVKYLKKIGAVVKAHPYITAATLTTIVAGGYFLGKTERVSNALGNAKEFIVNANDRTTLKGKVVIGAEVLALIGVIYFLTAKITVEEKAELISQLANQLPDATTDAAVTPAV